MGIHTLNIDGDIGPLLQAMKLRTLKDTAAQQGRHSLTGAEIELMNLAGPMTGLEMLDEPGASAPTAIETGPAQSEKGSPRRLTAAVSSFVVLRTCAAFEKA